MKVNISGRGIIPGINRLAPVRGVDLSEKEVRRLINYRQFSVYEAATGLYISSANVDEMFKPVIVKPIIEEEKKPEYVELTADIVPTVVEEKKIEIIEEPIKEEEVISPSFLTVTELPSTIEETTEETTPVEVETTVEEVTETEEKPAENTEVSRPYYNRKKNRKR